MADADLPRCGYIACCPGHRDAPAAGPVDASSRGLTCGNVREPEAADQPRVPEQAAERDLLARAGWYRPGRPRVRRTPARRGSARSPSRRRARRSSRSAVARGTGGAKTHPAAVTPSALHWQPCSCARSRTSAVEPDPVAVGIGRLLIGLGLQRLGHRGVRRHPSQKPSAGSSSPGVEGGERRAGAHRSAGRRARRPRTARRRRRPPLRSTPTPAAGGARRACRTTYVAPLAYCRASDSLREGHQELPGPRRRRRSTR